MAAKPLPAAPPPVRKAARTGMTVEHPKYGTGTVVRREGDGDDAKITVSFPRFWHEEAGGEICGAEERLK